VDKQLFQIKVFIHLNEAFENHVSETTLPAFANAITMLLDLVGTHGSNADNEICYIAGRAIQIMLNEGQLYKYDDYIIPRTTRMQLIFLKTRLSKIVNQLSDKQWANYARKYQGV